MYTHRRKVCVRGGPLSKNLGWFGSRIESARVPGTTVLPAEPAKTFSERPRRTAELNERPRRTAERTIIMSGSGGPPPKGTGGKDYGKGSKSAWTRPEAKGKDASGQPGGGSSGKGGRGRSADKYPEAKAEKKKQGGGSSQQYSKWNWEDSVSNFLKVSPGRRDGQTFLEYQQAQALWVERGFGPPYPEDYPEPFFHPRCVFGSEDMVRHPELLLFTGGPPPAAPPEGVQHGEARMGHHRWMTDPEGIVIAAMNMFCQIARQENLHGPQ